MIDDDDSSSSGSVSEASVTSIPSSDEGDNNAERLDHNVISSMNGMSIRGTTKTTDRERLGKLGRYNLNLDDSSDSDSSLDMLTPIFPRKRPPAVVVDDSDDSSIEVVENIQRKEHTKSSDLSNCESLWKMNKEKGEYSLKSSSKTSMPNFRVPSELFDKLFDHQKSGVSWMAGLHSQRMGGLLGDDMGMGKTYMTLTLLGGLMRAGTIQNALIIAPLSVLRSWETEASKVVKLCVPKIKIQVLSSDIGKSTRCRRLRDALEW